VSAAPLPAIAATITNPYSQADALAGLVEALGTAGDYERAETIANTITNPNSQARALAELVKTLGTAGDYERAATIANTITDPDSQARALAWLALTAAVRNDGLRARRLIAEAWIRADWSTPLEALAAVDPSALRSLADEINP
jgi:hypothetical protein